MTSSREKAIAALKRSLQAGDPKKLEPLAADLLSRLIQVPMSVAKSGFQRGGDAGTSGYGGRHLRVECKRYRDDTPLGDRELLGEIDHALNAEPFLEAWVLVSTRAVSEGTRQQLDSKARKIGVAVITIDWTSAGREMPELAALCACSPDLVELHYGKRAAASARALGSAAKPIARQLMASLASWNIGFEQLRLAAARRLIRIWTNAGESQAVLAQNVAGGTAAYLVRREPVLAALDQWWEAKSSSPAVVVGAEGVGKTWATLHWLQSNLGALPVVITLAASSFTDLKSLSEHALREFLAQALLAVSELRDDEYWRKRLDQLLKRPNQSGPAMLLLVDGINQVPDFEWLRLVQLLRGDAFNGKIRLLLSTQGHFLEQRLRGFRGLEGGITRVPVDPYDASPRGELDGLLASHRKTLADIPTEVMPLARVPRLLPLVLRSLANRELEGDPTLSRLLWEYGRDELGIREQRAFTESDWENWLQAVASSLHDEISKGDLEAVSRSYTLHELSPSVSASWLHPSDVDRRLSEIIDRTWAEPIPYRPGSYRLRESTVHLALGLALLRLLEDDERKDPQRVSASLSEWLDPFAATPAAAEILATAMSLAIARHLPSDSPILASIVQALLQSQNARESTRSQVRSCAPAIVPPLLLAAERFDTRALAFARQTALVALRNVPAKNATAWRQITDRLVDWVAHVQCPKPISEKAQADEDHEAFQAKRLQVRIGVSTPGVHKVMGVGLRLHPWEQEDQTASVPGLLFGKPLMNADRIFAALAVAGAAGNSRSWEGFKWLIALNQVDFQQTVARLEEMANAALSVDLEPGVAPDFAKRVSSLLLFLTTVDNLEQRAGSMKVSFDQRPDYQADYLDNPTRSLFTLEHRHLGLLWSDHGIPLVRRVKTAEEYLPDPSLPIDPGFAQAVAQALNEFDPATLDTSRAVDIHDITISEFMPGAARFAPRALAALIGRWFVGLKDRRDESRHWAAFRGTNYILLADAQAAAAAAAARSNGSSPQRQDEEFVQTSLLQLQIAGLAIDEQLDALIEATQAHLTLDLMAVLRQGDRDAIKRLLQRSVAAKPRVAEVALNYLAAHQAALDASAFGQLVIYAEDTDQHMRNLAFIGLAAAEPKQLGKHLLATDWRVTSSQSIFEQDHGSRALLAAGDTTPFDILAWRIAPWHLLAEVRRRGSKAQDISTAVAILVTALDVNDLQDNHPGVEIAVNAADRPGQISFEPSEDVEEDPAEALRLRLDSAAQFARHTKAHDLGVAYIDYLRGTGAVFAIRVVDLEDARLLLERCNLQVRVWLEGARERSSAFVKRANLATGLFLALCEALLEKGDVAGREMWDALDETVRKKFIGRGELNELLHIPFRVEDNPVTLALRDHLYSLARNLNDSSYLALVVAATSNSRSTWLKKKADDDLMAATPWRIKRGVFIHGLAKQIDPLAPVWRDGIADGLTEWLHRRADQQANGLAFARYWWRRYLESATPADAFAAWRVLLVCIDRRALAWLNDDEALFGRSDELGRLKKIHAYLNRSELERAIRDRESKGAYAMNNHLFGWDSPDQWFDGEQLSAVAA